MRLPRADQAHVPTEKLTDYLLDVTHPAGGPKAHFFRAFGFAPDDPEVLRTALLLHARNFDVIRMSRTDFSVNYRLRGSLLTPDGRQPTIVSIWKIELEGAPPQFVTAFPD